MAFSHPMLDWANDQMYGNGFNGSNYGWANGTYPQVTPSVSSAASAEAATLRNWQQQQNEAAMKFEADQALLNRTFQEQSAKKAMNFEANQAELNRLFQKQSAQEAMNFESEQARIGREFQQLMSDTAYQRVVKDLKAAGLNPILAVSNGAASSPSGFVGSGFSSSGSKGSGFSSSGSSASGFSSSGAMADVVGAYNAQTNRADYNLRKQYAAVYAMSGLLTSAGRLIGSFI